MDALERFLGLRLKLLNRWHGYDFDELFPGSSRSVLRSRLTRSQNSIENDFDASDVSGRTKESRGETTPGNHIDSTNRGDQSVENAVEAIDDALEAGELTPEAVALLEEMRDDLTDIKTEMIDATVPK